VGGLTGGDRSIPGDQAAVPGQQRGRSDDSIGPQPVGEQAGHLRTQHRDFVTQDEDLDILGGGAAGEQSEPAEQPACDQIQQSERHDR
jgi:hypothetical protein